MYKRQIYQIAESNRNFFCPNWNALPASAQIHQAFDGQSSLTGSITLHACPPRASLADDQFHSHSHACGHRETDIGAHGGTDRRHDEQGQLPPRISEKLCCKMMLARPQVSRPRPQPHVAAALPVPDNAQRMNQHYFYEALKYSQRLQRQ